MSKNITYFGIFSTPCNSDDSHLHFDDLGIKHPNSPPIIREGCFLLSITHLKYN